MIHPVGMLRSLLAASVCLQAMAPGIAAAQTTVGTVGTFRFGTAAVGGPSFEQPAQTMPALTGAKTEFDLSASNPEWAYVNASAGLVHTVVAGSTPPGAVLGLDGKLKVEAFRTIGADYSFTVRATNAAGVSAKRSFVFPSAPPTAVAAATARPTTIGSDRRPDIAVASFYDADANTIQVAAGETLTFRFPDFVSAAEVLTVLAPNSAPTVATISYANPDGTPGASVQASVGPGAFEVTSFAQPAVSKEFKVQFAGAAVLSDLRIGTGAIGGRPVFGFGEDAVLADIARAAGTTIPLLGSTTDVPLALVSGTLPPGARLQGSSLVMGSTTSPEGGPWSFAIAGTDARGFSTGPRTFSVSADPSSVAAAKTLLPTALSSTANLVNEGTTSSTPVAYMLSDDNASTYFRTSQAGTSLDVALGAPASFSEIYVRSTGPLDVSLRQPDGTWNKIATAPAFPTGGVFSLGRTYVASTVRFASTTNAYTKVDEFRIGAGSPAHQPVSMLPSSRRWTTSTVVASLADFQKSTWATGTTLSLVGTVPAGTTTDGSVVRMASDPASDVAVRVRATDSMGLWTEASVLVGAASAVDGATILPSAITTSDNIYPNAVRIATLHDGASNTSGGANSSGLLIEYPVPITFDKFYLWNNQAATLQMDVGGGVFQTISTNLLQSSGGVVDLGRSWTGKRFRFVASASAIYEFRPNAGPVAAGPTYAGASTVLTADAGGVLLRASDFLPGTYSTGTTLSIVGGQGLPVSAQNGEIRIAGTLETDTSFVVRATGSSGLNRDTTFSVVAPRGIDGATVLPATVSSANDFRPGNSMRAMLQDGLTTTGGQANAVTLGLYVEYAAPISLNRFYIQADYQVDLQMDMGGGNYQNIKTGIVQKTGGVVALDRTYTGRRFRIVYSPSGPAIAGAVNEFRPNEAPTTAAPTFKGASTTLSADAGGVLLRTSDFNDLDPYSDTIALAVRSVQTGLGVSVVGDEVRLSGRPTVDSTFTVRATSGSGLWTDVVVTVPAAPGIDSSTILPSNITSYYSVAPGQSLVAALADGSDATYGQANSSTNGLYVEYATPVSMDRFFIKNQYSVDLEMETTSNTFVKIKTGILQTTGGIVALDRSYTGKRFRLSVSAGASYAGNVFEFRPNNAPITLAPTFKGTSTILSADAGGVLLRASDFNDLDPYSDTIVLTVSNASTGLGVSVVDNEVRLSGRPTVDSTFTVRAKSGSGLWTDTVVTILAAPGVDAATVLPSAITSYYSMAPGQSLLAALHDGLDTTYGQANSGIYGLYVEYASPVSMDRFFVKNQYAVDLEMETSTNVYAKIKTGILQTAGGTVMLDRTYTGRRFRLAVSSGASYAGNVFEFRPNLAPVTLAPVYAGTATLLEPDAGGVLLRASQFTDRDPYTDVVTLTIPSPPAGLQVSVVGGEVRLAQRPADDTSFVVRATSGSGLWQDTTFTALAVVVPPVDGATLLPTSVSTTGTIAKGSNVRTMLHDGSDATNGQPGAGTAGLYVQYASPISLSSFWIKHSDRVDLQMETGGSFVTIKSNILQTAGGVVALDKTYTGKRFRLNYNSGASYQGLVYEFRPNNGPLSQDPTFGGITTRTRDASGNVLSASDFTSRDGYGFPSTIVLSIVNAGGLTGLTTDGSTVKLSGDTTSDATIQVRATSANGSYILQSVVVKATKPATTSVAARCLSWSGSANASTCLDAEMNVDGIGWTWFSEGSTKIYDLWCVAYTGKSQSVMSTKNPASGGSARTFYYVMDGGQTLIRNIAPYGNMQKGNASGTFHTEIRCSQW